MEFNILLIILLINSLTACLKQVVKILNKVKKVTVSLSGITVTFKAKD